MPTKTQARLISRRNRYLGILDNHLAGADAASAMLDKIDNEIANTITFDEFEPHAVANLVNLTPGRSREWYAKAVFGRVTPKTVERVRWHLRSALRAKLIDRMPVSGPV